MIIHKYQIGLLTTQVISAPEGARFLHVGEQQGEVVLWALVDLSNTVRTYDIAVCGTGMIAPDPYEADYIGTVQAYDGYVWHVFVRKEEEVIA